MNRREMPARVELITTGGLLVLPAAVQASVVAGSGVLDVKDYGAAADGKRLDTLAINRTIDACRAAGGGVVYFRTGVLPVRHGGVAEQRNIASGGRRDAVG